MPQDAAEKRPTAFAAAERSSPEVLRRQRAAFLTDRIGAEMLEAMPGPAMVLNTDRQIVAINQLMAAMLPEAGITSLLGQRPGEAVGCVHAPERPGGCGTAEACSTCGAVRAILRCLHTRSRTTEECRILVRGADGPGALDLRVHATYISVGGEDLIIIGLADVSSEKRKQVLERLFFHDLLNAVGGVHGVAQMLAQGEVDPDRHAEYAGILRRSSEWIIEEIQGHRTLIEAERGDLVVRPGPVDMVALVEDVANLYRTHEVAEERTIAIRPFGPLVLFSQSTLLRRAIGNLVKNALEATSPGGVVTVACEHDESRVRLTVHNPGVIASQTRLQIFQRSFSTKQGSGRGVGSYSVRLLTEKYLRGEASFQSDETAGTTFAITIPLQRA